tara:strand:+ start:333 stop:980 length:648 start_codon:yes stop_codon:yes gene_type:complete
MQKQILYSFRRCPYAIRARWALKACNIEVELREVSLKNKPQDIIIKSKNKTVPLLILDNGDVKDESLDIVLWALSKSKMHENLFMKKKFKKEIFELIKENDHIFKFHLDRFKYSKRFNMEEEDFHYEKAKNIIRKWNTLLNEDKRSNKYLIGNQETICDWCLWPFVRQFKIACVNQKKKDYFPYAIERWLETFEKHNFYEEVMFKYKLWEEPSKI